MLSATPAAGPLTLVFAKKSEEMSLVPLQYPAMTLWLSLCRKTDVADRWVGLACVSTDVDLSEGLAIPCEGR